MRREKYPSTSMGKKKKISLSLKGKEKDKIIPSPLRGRAGLGVIFSLPSIESTNRQKCETFT
jgi:hypothetical protein